MNVCLLNVAGAIAFLNQNGSAAALALVPVLEQHAENESLVSIVVSNDEVEAMTFTSTHPVDVEMEVGDTIISIHEASGLVTATVSRNLKTQPKEKTMNAQAQATQAQSTIPPVYSAEERDALLAKMATMQEAMDEMAKVKQQASPNTAAAPEAESALATKIGKGILYVGGAAVVGAASLWAWKKWGSGSSASA